ncbi:MAG: c-type cytochrome [Acidimicrobiales bacterium]
MAYEVDESLERSTNKVMALGAVLMIALVLVFPLYRWVEPTNRDQAREDQLQSLAESGAQTWSFNCQSCHGLNGEGAIGPALNSQQFLTSASDEQIQLLVSVGVPGTQMGAYDQDHGGPLTSEQIKSVVTYIRSWERAAPDRPDWLDFPFTGDTAGATADTASTDTTTSGDAEG